MDVKSEDGYLLGISPQHTPPRPKSLAQLAEEQLGSLQYLLASSSKRDSSCSRASPPPRSRPRASTGIVSLGASSRGRRSRRSTSGDIEETATATAATSSGTPNRGLFSSDRPRSQGSASGRLSLSNGKGGRSGRFYRLSIDNVNRAAAAGSANGSTSSSSSASAGVKQQGQWLRPPFSRSVGSTPERGRGLTSSESSRGYGLAGFVGIRSKDDDVESFFCYDGSENQDQREEDVEGDEEGEDEEEEDEDAYGRRRRLQNSCCLLGGVSWASALLLYASGSLGAWGTAATAKEALYVAIGCALLGLIVLAILVLFIGLPIWPNDYEDGDEDEEVCCCFCWGRGKRGGVDEGGKLDTVGGVTYLAI